MFHVALSQLTMPRWELPEEIARLAAHGFDSLSLWRVKLSDIGQHAAASLLTEAGVRVSSLQWAGGFTGGDGRTFTESIDDAQEAIEAAHSLGAAVLVIHSGGRGGHTRAHARRLLIQALEKLLPLAHHAGVTLAIKPMHAAAAPDCSFLTRPVEALDIVEGFADPAVRMALDLWQFGDDLELVRLLPRLAAATVAVQVADRVGAPSTEFERLPAGYGSLPLESLVAALLEQGYQGHFEFDPVGDTVAGLGYERVLSETRRVANLWTDLWAERMVPHMAQQATATAGWRHPDPWMTSVTKQTTHESESVGMTSMTSMTSMTRDEHAPAGLQLRPAGSRRSHASSQTVSRG